MKIIVFGLGSIGQRHVKRLKKITKHEIYAFRSSKQRGNQLKIPEVYTFKQVEALNPDVAFICNPTSLHIKTAIRCAQRGMHLFIEKPLGSSDKDLGKLKQIVKRKKLSCYTAYVLRFHPVINELKKYLKSNRFYHMRVTCTSLLHQWRVGYDTKKGYSANKKMGGGVIFDLSHEIDYVKYLIGDIKKITGKHDRQSNITVDAEDYADLLIESKRGPANVHVNFMSQKAERLIKVDFKDRMLEGDLINNTISEYRAGKLYKKRKLTGTLQNCFDKQLRYFFSNIGKKTMMNNLDESSEVLQTILKYKKS